MQEQITKEVEEQISEETAEAKEKATGLFGQVKAFGAGLFGKAKEEVDDVKADIEEKVSEARGRY